VRIHRITGHCRLIDFDGHRPERGRDAIPAHDFATRSTRDGTAGRLDPSLYGEFVPAHPTAMHEVDERVGRRSFS
jgi:hypothetical protein